MPSAWGTSWGSSWGNSFGSLVPQIPATADVTMYRSTTVTVYLLPSAAPQVTLSPSRPAAVLELATSPAVRSVRRTTAMVTFGIALPAVADLVTFGGNAVLFDGNAVAFNP